MCSRFSQRNIKRLYRLLRAKCISFVTASAIFLILCIAAISFCTETGAAENKASWTLCLYLCGSNLETRQGWASKTLKELKSSDAPESVNVVIQAGGAVSWENEYVQKNGQRLVLKDGSFQDAGMAEARSMGESETLADFLTFCEAEYPADHTAVVLWNHGSGPLRGVCFDEEASFDALTLPELGTGIKAGVEARGGIPYDIVGFDACLMGSFETAVALKGSADWMVASEEIESGAGWDYGPIIEAMGREDANARVVSVAVCDGYEAKSAKRGKGNAITLAALELAQLPALEQAMEEVYIALQENVGIGIGALRRLAFGAQTAESFGGGSDREGRSNLVDLKGLAVGCAEAYGTEDVPWDRLAEAVDTVVAYNVQGKVTSGASGISIWYPIALKDSGLTDYVAMSPLVRYASVLKELFSINVGEVSFLDAGSVKDENFCVTIDPESADSFFDIYVINRRVDGSYEDHNVDRVDDWDTLSFYWQPSRAVEVTLNGMPLDVRVVSYTEDYMVFTSPVRVNGEDCFLRFSWIDDEENPEGGYYEFLGIWNGVDHVSGLAGRFLSALERGDEVQALSLQNGEARESVIIEDDVQISDIPMEAGEYECCFVALDLYGREYPSGVCRYSVDEAGNVTVVG